MVKRLEEKKRERATPAGRRRAYGHNLQSKYGITLEHWDVLVLAQEGRCALCHTAAEELVLDHCHSTGRVRGLLCRNCNRCLGRWGDNVEGIRSVLDYLTG